MATLTATEGIPASYIELSNDSSASFNINSNVTNTTSWRQYPSSSRIVFSSFELVLASIGAVANALVFWIIAKNRKMRTVPNIFVLNLSIADFIYCSMFLPFWDSYQMSVHGWNCGRVMCNVIVAVSDLSVNASTLFLTAMSVERYRAVVDPIGHLQRQSLKKTWLVSGILWLAAILPSLPFAVLSTTKESRIFGNTTWVSCQLDPPEGMDYAKFQIVTHMWRFLAWFVVPLVIIAPLYTLLIKKIREKEQFPRLGPATMQSQVRVTRMVTVVVFIFMLSWLPIHVRNIVYFFNQEAMPEGIYFLIAALSSANSTVNPFLYALLGENFYAYTKKALLRCCHTSRSAKQRGITGDGTSISLSRRRTIPRETINVDDIPI
ncbi:PREDICTED: somatostatin receptor type 5-like [Branchiostoma belcheri]|uniref:Somatostatin receptor type 5-like n=1 Tax=Branchiostoma belcheri TaxID=7741 RepID=A0A6P4YLJ5_BRABE|nr:PREDICTED: somatostatin receptor type 5-like [Branchiostoma belcheri]